LEAEAVADGLDCGDSSWPGVARRPLRLSTVHGDGVRMHDGEHRTGSRMVGDDQRAALIEADVTVGGRAGEQVGPGELSDPPRAGPPGDLGGGAGLGDATVVEDDDVISQDGGIDRIMGDEETNTGERGEVAAKVAPDLVAGGGVERGERLVQQQDLRLGRERAGQCDSLRLSA